MLAPIPCYPFPESAAIALARATAYGEWKWRDVGRIPELEGIDMTRARGIVDTGLSRGGGWLAPVEVERSADGLRNSGGAGAARAGTEEEAAGSARAIGFPVALKAVGPSILHKTEVGGIRLGLADETAVVAGCRDLKSRLGAELTGFPRSGDGSGRGRGASPG